MTIVLLPLLKAPVSHRPPSAVDVCAVLSRFVHVTVSPTFTLTLWGWNEKFLIETDALAALARVAAPADTATTARTATRAALKC